MRQLADLVGISNPYLSQIERGLRDPSEKVLDAIAQNLQLSADALQEHGGRRPDGDEDEGGEPAVVAAIRADPKLTPRQRQALLGVYNAFVDRGAHRAMTVAAPERRDRRLGERTQETSSRAAPVYAFAISRVKSACDAAVLAIQSTLVVPAAFS